MDLRYFCIFIQLLPPHEGKYFAINQHFDEIIRNHKKSYHLSPANTIFQNIYSICEGIFMQRLMNVLTIAFCTVALWPPTVRGISQTSVYSCATIPQFIYHKEIWYKDQLKQDLERRIKNIDPEKYSLDLFMPHISSFFPVYNYDIFQNGYKH